jgi:hypothetical protein
VECQAVCPVECQVECQEACLEDSQEDQVDSLEAQVVTLEEEPHLPEAMDQLLMTSTEHML